MLSCDYKKNTEMETNTNQKVSCLVNYSYDASEADELTIRPGDILREVERLPGGWWRGELRGRWGMFPDNFVSVLTEQNNARPSSVQGRCRAVYSYQPANPDELPLSVGDVLEVLNEVEEGWWKGRRSGRVGVFPSNFVVMLDASLTPAPPALPAPPVDPAPALPPKPVKELCRVLFPYSAVNEDELNLSEGDVVTIVSKEAPDRGWWKGELQGRVGFFPDNFVQLLPAVAHEVEEKKPDRPPSKTNTLYPVLNKYSEKTASVKELITSKISMHKENSKEITSQSNITQTSKNETEKIIHSESVDGSPDGQIKKPPVPLKKSPTPGSMSGLLSGLKNKMMSSTDKTEKTEKNTVLSSSGEWDRTDGISASKTSANTNSNSQPNSTNTFDHIERNSILNDPRAGRVKAPRRRPPSQSLRDDTPQQIGLSNGHEVPSERAASREEIRPRAREWEKHRAPWMAELKLNQARKTSSGTDARTKPGDRTSEGGLEEKRTSHSMEMSKSTSSISNRISVLESLECSLETKMRTSETKKDSLPPELPTTRPPSLQSPTAAGRTITSMLDEVRKPPAPAPPSPAVALMTPATGLVTPATGLVTPAIGLMTPAAGLVSPAAGLVAPAVGLVTPTVALVTPAAPLATLISPLAASAATPAGPLAPPVAARLADTDRSPKHDKTDRFPSLDRSDKSEVIKSSGLEKSTDKVNDVTKTSGPDKSEKVNDVSKLTRSSSTDKFNDVQSFSVIAAFSAIDKTVERNEVTSKFSSVIEKNTSIEKNGRTEMSRSNTLEMKAKSDKECSDVLIAQLNNRILNLEKLIEVQNAKFNTAIEDLSNKLKQESEKRQALQMEIEKLAHCVTQV